MINEKPTAAVVRDENITLAVNKALDQLVLPDLNGKSILLKPNAGREVDPCLGINTNPEVTAAVFHYLKKRYRAVFYIGDSPIISTDTHRAFKQSGYSGLLSERELNFIDMDSPEPVTLPIENGLVIKSIRVTGYWTRFDFIVSIPVLKMHMHTGVSLGIKNLKGLIYKRDKIALHHQEAPGAVNRFSKDCPKIKELDLAIADFTGVVRPHLTVIDGSYAQEGMGPSSGERKKLDLIIASTDLIAADITALALVQPTWTLKDVPHLKIISDQMEPEGPRSIKDIKTLPENLEEFISPLEPPPSSITMKYENVNVIDIESCSACLSTIFLFLKNNRDFIDAHFSKERPLNLVIGKGIKDVSLYEPSFLVGKCTAERKDEGHYIKGCCPVQSRIRTVIEEYLEKNKS